MILPGELWVADIPFNDQSASKRRPVFLRASKHRLLRRHNHERLVGSVCGGGDKGGNLVIRPVGHEAEGGRVVRRD
jgi:hypothetical protein